MIAPPASLPIIHPADHQPGPPQGGWTYATYAALPDDGQRYEVIDGVLYMAPAPMIPHQRIVGRIYRLLATTVESTQIGEAFVSPIDVELAPNVVVQPDVLVIVVFLPLREALGRPIEMPIVRAQQDLSGQQSKFGGAFPAPSSAPCCFTEHRRLMASRTSSPSVFKCWWSCAARSTARWTVT